MPEHRTQGGFSRKHDPETVVDEALKSAVAQAARDGELPCAVAFAVAGKGPWPPLETGKAADLLDLRLTKCQLGLFGYAPKNKIVTPADPDAALREALAFEAPDGRITCAAIWRIAGRLDRRKLAVSRACEAMGLRIKSCQLGAF